MSLEHFSKEILGKDIPLYSLKIALHLLSNDKDVENIDELCKKMFITKRKLTGEFDKFKPIEGFFSVEKEKSDYIFYILNKKYTLESPKKKKKTTDTQVKAVSERESHIQALFALWCQLMGKTSRTTLDVKRRKDLNTALEKNDFEVCRKALVGCSKSTWHMGVDPKTYGKKYNSIEIIFRNEDKLEYFLDLYDAPSLEEQQKIIDSNKTVKIEDRLGNNEWLSQRMNSFNNEADSGKSIEDKKAEQLLLLQSEQHIKEPSYDVDGLAIASLKCLNENQKDLDNDDEIIETAIFEEIEEEEIPLYLQFAKNKDK